MLDGLTKKSTFFFVKEFPKLENNKEGKHGKEISDEF